MRFKIDENLPVELGNDLIAAGHDAVTVSAEGLAGARDEDLRDHVAREDRILLTMDKGIADPRRPGTRPPVGIVLFRPASAGRGEVLAFIRRHLPLLLTRELTGRVVVYESQELGANGSRPSDERAVWCLNLAQLTEFAQAFNEAVRFRLFGLHRDPLTPATAEAGRPDRKQRRALIPIKWFLEQASDRDRLGNSQGTIAEDAVRALLGDQGASSKLRDLRTQPLFDVRMIDRADLPAVISAYNRINSAGKRVEPEERTFARLVSVNGAEDYVRKFFEQCHPPERHARGKAQADESRLERDDLIRREKENRFGFKLFMRAFVIAFAYHADRSIGSSVFSFDAVDVRSLEEGKQHLDQILESTVKATADAANILREQLYCDDFRMLPDTQCLWPVFQCLIRFPGLASTCPERLAAVILRLMVADLTRGPLLELVRRVNEASSVSDALAVFDRKPLEPRSVVRAIRDGVRSAQSLMDRYALVFYWLLRKRRARDFSYKANVPERATDLRHKYTDLIEVGAIEPSLSQAVTPQKQHMVPYSMLENVFGLSGARPGQHEVHNLGNLTYISGELNGLTGMASSPLEIDREPRANLRAHLLEDRTVLEAFKRCCGGTSKTNYRKFYRRRAQQITEALIEWEEALRTAISRPTEPTESGQPRLLAPTLDDRIRGFEYSSQLAQLLVGLPTLGWHEGRKSRRKSAADELRLVERRERSGRHQRVRVDLVPRGDRLRVKVSDTALQRKFAKDLPGITKYPRKGALNCSLDTRKETGDRDAVEVVKWLLKFR